MLKRIVVALTIELDEDEDSESVAESLFNWACCIEEDAIDSIADYSWKPGSTLDLGAGWN